jgi:hypothetical protein
VNSSSDGGGFPVGEADLAAIDAVLGDLPLDD